MGIPFQSSSVQSNINIDSTVTQGSSNPVSSDAVFDAFQSPTFDTLNVSQTTTLNEATTTNLNVNGTFTLGSNVFFQSLSTVPSFVAVGAIQLMANFVDSPLNVARALFTKAKFTFSSQSHRFENLATGTTNGTVMMELDSTIAKFGIPIVNESDMRIIGHNGDANNTSLIRMNTGSEINLDCDFFKVKDQAGQNSNFEISGSTNTSDVSCNLHGQLYVKGNDNNGPTFRFYNNPTRAVLNSSAELLLEANNTSNTEDSSIWLGTASIGILFTTENTNGIRFRKGAAGSYATLLHITHTNSTFSHPCRAPSFPLTSDDRIKFNETPINDGLQVIRLLNPQRYDKAVNVTDVFNVDSTNTYVEIGLIAQELDQIEQLKHCVVPEEESEEGIRPMAIRYNDVLIYAIQGLKELDATVTTQSAIIQTLSQRISALESK